ncbi:MAG: MoaD/ThiS family protein [Anaerolineae bacterium]|nr:MoaD/ThiS family protein [Anaerolineae bacterium]
MNVLVEFTGVARVLAGTQSVSLDLQDRVSFQDIVQHLGATYPVLVGQVIQPDGRTLYPSNFFNLNGKRMLKPTQMHESPQNGDHIVVMSILAGG